MIFRDKETGAVFENSDAVIAHLCDSRNCLECPVMNAAHGDSDYCCYEFGEDNPEKLAELLNMELTPSKPAADTNVGHTEKPDMVNQPPHYTAGGIECADALDAMVSVYPDPNAAALAWQVGKYIWRHPLKWNPLEDLKKARWYLDRLIAHYEKKEASDGK